MDLAAAMMQRQKPTERACLQSADKDCKDVRLGRLSPAFSISLSGSDTKPASKKKTKDL